jgi:hypothetical protein
MNSSRAVCRMNCLFSLGRWNRGFESHSRHGCLCVRLFCVCVVLCSDSGLATGWSLVQGVLPSVKIVYRTEWEAWALSGLEYHWKEKMNLRTVKLTILCGVLPCSRVGRYQRLDGSCCLPLNSRRVKKETASFSETQVSLHQITWHHIPGDRNVSKYERKNLKSHT